MKIIFQIVLACIMTILWFIVYIISSILEFLWTFNINSFKMNNFKMDGENFFIAVEALWSEKNDGRYYIYYKTYFHYIWNIQENTFSNLLNKLKN